MGVGEAVTGCLKWGHDTHKHLQPSPWHLIPLGLLLLIICSPCTVSYIIWLALDSVTSVFQKLGIFIKVLLASNHFVLVLEQQQLTDSKRVLATLKSKGPWE